jgi:hypothetical protein
MLVEVVHTKARRAHSKVTGSKKDQRTESHKEKHFNELHLFGKYKLRGKHGQRGKQGHSIEKSDSRSYSGAFENTSVLDARTASRVFSVYMTLLECIAAQYQRSYGEEKRGKTVHETTQGYDWSTVDDIHKACSIELGFAYRNAVAWGKKDESIEDQQQLPETDPVNRDQSDTDTTESENKPPSPLKHKSPRLPRGKKARARVEIMKQSSKGKDSSLEEQQAAVLEVCKHEHHPNVMPSLDLVREIKQLKEDIRREKDGMEFCPYRCGQITRFIIVAWAHQVQILVWDENEGDRSTKGKESERGEEREQREDEQTKREDDEKKFEKFDEQKRWLKSRKRDVDYSVMPSVDSFPDISALGGA